MYFRFLDITSRDPDQKENVSTFFSNDTVIGYVVNLTIA